jgi:nucleoside-diphosphate-sugar epimerase
MTATRSVLVTGGNGFIGRHLVRRLLRDGHDVSLLLRSPDPVDPRAARLSLSRFDAEGIAVALRGRRFDWVFHLAGYGVHPGDRDAEMMFRVNVDVTRILVELASSCSPRAVVIAGSGSEYDFDGVEGPLTEYHPLEPYKLYGASKAAATLCTAALATARQMPFAACRIFGVYGPGEAPHRLVPSLISRLHGSGRIPLSAGLQKRDFLFVDDVVDVFTKVAVALESEPRQFILNVGTGQPIAVRDFAQSVATIAGIAASRLGFGDIPMRLDEPMIFSGNSERLHTLTGWTAKVGVADGIRRCLDAHLVAPGIG